MRRVKSTQWVTGQFYRSASFVALGAGFLVAMVAGDGDRVLAPSLPVLVTPVLVTAAPQHRPPASGTVRISAEAEQDSTDIALGGDDPPAFVGAYARLDLPVEAGERTYAPLPGYAREGGADRPSPQQLERLIAQSYARSGSDGGGD